MRTLATAIILLFGAALIIVHQRYNSAISKALEEESTPVPVPLGPIDSPVEPSLRFHIQNVRHNQRVEPEGRPNASATSDWTVFDCIPDDDPSAAFRLALSPIPPVTGHMPVGSSDAILWVTDRNAGDRFVNLLASVLQIEAPARRKPPGPLKALKISVSVLGQHLPPGDGTQIIQHDSDGGSRSGKRGPWTATRWFVEHDGLESEVWCNYDLHGGRGEIVRKSTEDRNELLLAMATCLRDGPRPPRTPLDDPSLTLTGPHVRDIRHVSSQANSYLFTPRGSIILVSVGSGSSVSLVDPLQIDALATLAKLEGMVAAVLCADDRDERFFIQEASAISLEGMAWWQAPQRIWRVDRKSTQCQLISGPWGESGSVAGPLALSPDGRYLIISHRRVTSDGERLRATYIHDVQTGRSRKAEFDSSAEVMSWTGGTAEKSGGPLRCSVMTGGSWRLGPDYQRQCYSLDPTTGDAEAISEIVGADPTVSPDGKHRAEFRSEDQVKIVEIATGTTTGTFFFHVDDRRFAREGSVAWLSPRFLHFRGKRQATIDITTMKMCYLTTPDEPRVFMFSQNFDWAVTTDDDGLHVGKVVIDSRPPTSAPITSARDIGDDVLR